MTIEEQLVEELKKHPGARVMHVGVDKLLAWLEENPKRSYRLAEDSTLTSSRFEGVVIEPDYEDPQALWFEP